MGYYKHPYDTYSTYVPALKSYLGSQWGRFTDVSIWVYSRRQVRIKMTDIFEKTEINVVLWNE